LDEVYNPSSLAAKEEYYSIAVKSNGILDMLVSANGTFQEKVLNSIVIPKKNTQSDKAQNN
jgi:hypothetical protein